ncbi:MAG: 4-amino-4-deoxy-L-arabinose-phosphoundecaprenol flippase subunit ArnE [Candidatus Lokiarchaeum sp. GC14_75]|nr:MAG: 4-amino-4-deoxy-L-arabinose-phosphoundecaprenol flippase subunit ArnE [Candidatus Lokiarchaeum sp. GC14_75]
MVDLVGIIFTGFTIFMWATASLVYKAGLEKTQPKANLFFRLCLVSIGTFVFSSIFGNYSFLTVLDSSELLGYLILCAISGFSVTFGDLLYYKALTKIEASRAYPIVQLSLIFVYPLSFFFFGEELHLSILIGGFLFLISVFILSKRDNSEEPKPNKTIRERFSENLVIGIFLATGTAFFWAIAIISFNQARIITDDVFVTNFFRVILATSLISIVGIFQSEYYSGFKIENRKNLKYFFYIGIAGILSLGFADTLFYKAAEINGLVLTTTLTVNTPMVQQILSIIFLKEKFRPRFLIAVSLIVLGNYLILFF